MYFLWLHSVSCHVQQIFFNPIIITLCYVFFWGYILTLCEFRPLPCGSIVGDSDNVFFCGYTLSLYMQVVGQCCMGVLLGFVVMCFSVVIHSPCICKLWASAAWEYCWGVWLCVFLWLYTHPVYESCGPLLHGSTVGECGCVELEQHHVNHCLPAAWWTLMLH